MPERSEAWPEGTPCWIDMSAGDSQRVSEFYAALLGWDLEIGPPETGGYVMAKKNGKDVAGIGAKGPGMEEMPTFWGTYLAVDDLTAAIKRLTDAGGQALFEPMAIMDLGTMVFATDPSGAGFGLWQSGTMTGFGLYNEPGSVAWNELHTNDYAGAKEFYTAVAGVGYTVMGDTDDFRYSMITVDASSNTEHEVGGIMEDRNTPPGLDAYWLTYFSVEDCDAAAARATELGASVMMPPESTPYGRMAVLAGLEGETFAVLVPPEAA